MKKPLISILPVLTTVASIIKDKRKCSTARKKELASHKRLLNVVGSGAIITVALADIAA